MSEKNSVLLVDDDQEFRKAMKRMFERSLTISISISVTEVELEAVVLAELITDHVTGAGPGRQALVPTVTAAKAVIEGDLRQKIPW